ncbi:hypothetical protein BTUL_0050g00230 [Botrytis tulipae]|uniref:Uncharacterized protein n=1 Tax=Botrytis tulipae TaxID=87230 RepID=A0A4Z1EUD2_9HELO|nr:hypothetical protein BTUL_0050g00230 [Botrytis tulipae]
MSSVNCDHPLEMFTTTSTSNLEDDFAQTKEDFDVSSIPDSDSEDGGTIYYQTPEKGKKGGKFADKRMTDDKIFHGAFVSDLTGDEGQDEQVHDSGTAVRYSISSRFPTPTTGELIKYINDTDLLGDEEEESVTKSPTAHHQKLEELARIRRVITRNRVPDTHQTTQNSTSALAVAAASTGVRNFTSLHPRGTPLIRDFAIPPPPSNPIFNPHKPYTLETPQAHRGTNVRLYQSLRSCEYPAAVCIRTMYLYHGFLFRRTLDDLHISSSDKEEEEVYRELSAGEEADDEDCLYKSGPTPAPPRSPVLGNRDQSTEDSAENEEIEELENEGLFQILPRRSARISNRKRENREGLRASISSLPTIIPPLTIPIQSLQHLQIPRINPWPVIALAHQIPLFPTHILTSSSLAELSLYEKHLQNQNGYSSSPLDQWALTQHRLFLWINSGALENGIDGEMRRPGSADILLGIDGDSSELWDYEDVEVFVRWEGDTFRRCLEWVQDVQILGEGEEWGDLGLENQVYNFCGEEEILHRSVSEVDMYEKTYEDSSSSEWIEEEYDAEDERGEVRSIHPVPATQSHDPRLGRVVNIFRTRALQRLGITHQNSPFRQSMNHPAFRETGIQAADFARANAMARFERIAEDFARRERGAREVEDPVGQGEQSQFDGAEVHMRGGAGSEDPGKGSNDESPSTGSKSQNPPLPSASNPKRNTSLFHPRLQTQIDKIKTKIPPRLSIIHAIETLNQKLRIHSTTPRLLIRSATKLPNLISNLLPALSPSALLTTSTAILSAHTPMRQKILHGMQQIPAQIAALPSRTRHGISEMQKRMEERGKRQEERAELLKNDGSAKIDAELLTLEEQIWRNLKENAFKKRRSWEYEREEERKRDDDDNDDGDGGKKKKK